jgi:hypothetical protein
MNATTMRQMETYIHPNSMDVAPSGSSQIMPPAFNALQPRFEQPAALRKHTPIIIIIIIIIIIS